MSRKKIVASTTTNDGWVQPKPKKKRKPMTPEQKVAAAERLAKVVLQGNQQRMNQYIILFLH